MTDTNENQGPSSPPGPSLCTCPREMCKHRLRGLPHLPWLLPSSRCVHESQRSSSSPESCRPAASPCCSSSVSSPSSPACSENRSCSCSATASESGCGPWQLLGGRGHIRGPTVPSSPKILHSSLSQSLGNPAPVKLPPCSHPLCPSSPQQGALGRELAQGQPSAAPHNCPQAGFPPSSRFSLRSCCPWRKGLVPLQSGGHSQQEKLQHGQAHAGGDGHRSHGQQNKTSSPSQSPRYLKCCEQAQAKGKNEFLIFQFTLRKQMMH